MPNTCIEHTSCYLHIHHAHASFHLQCAPLAKQHGEHATATFYFVQKLIRHMRSACRSQRQALSMTWCIPQHNCTIRPRPLSFFTSYLQLQQSQRRHVHPDAAGAAAARHSTAPALVLSATVSSVYHRVLCFPQRALSATARSVTPVQAINTHAA
jgi:hypothetical protein